MVGAKAGEKATPPAFQATAPMTCHGPRHLTPLTDMFQTVLRLGDWFMKTFVIPHCVGQATSETPHCCVIMDIVPLVVEVIR